MAISRAQSIADRVHGSLVAAGRLPSVTGGPRIPGVVPAPRVSRFGLTAEASAVAAGSPAPRAPARARVGVSADGRAPPAAASVPLAALPAPPRASGEGELDVSPGLPDMGPEFAAAAGAAKVALSAPNTGTGGNAGARPASVGLHVSANGAAAAATAAGQPQCTQSSGDAGAAAAAPAAEYTPLSKVSVSGFAAGPEHPLGGPSTRHKSMAASSTAALRGQSLSKKAMLQVIASAVLLWGVVLASLSFACVLAVCRR
jgi:hypothetical protein